MKITKTRPGMYRIQITAGEAVGIFRCGRRWMVTHPRDNWMTDSFAQARTQALEFARGLTGAH